MSFWHFLNNYFDFNTDKNGIFVFIKSTKMNWNYLENIEQLATIKEASFAKPQLIFKHSTRCIISKMALKNFESDFVLQDVIDAYYLDLISYREISNKVADEFGITHQSPQILVIKNGAVVYNESHEGIDANILKEFV